MHIYFGLDWAVRPTLVFYWYLVFLYDKRVKWINANFMKELPVFWDVVGPTLYFHFLKGFIDDAWNIKILLAIVDKYSIFVLEILYCTVYYIKISPEFKNASFKRALFVLGFLHTKVFIIQSHSVCPQAHQGDFACYYDLQSLCMIAKLLYNNCKCSWICLMTDALSFNLTFNFNSQMASIRHYRWETYFDHTAFRKGHSLTHPSHSSPKLDVFQTNILCPV